jgi:hypothetical protein
VCVCWCTEFSFHRDSVANVRSPIDRSSLKPQYSSAWHEEQHWVKSSSSYSGLPSFRILPQRRAILTNSCHGSPQSLRTCLRPLLSNSLFITRCRVQSTEAWLLRGSLTTRQVNIVLGSRGTCPRDGLTARVRAHSVLLVCRLGGMETMERYKMWRSPIWYTITDVSAQPAVLIVMIPWSDGNGVTLQAANARTSGATLPTREHQVKHAGLQHLAGGHVTCARPSPFFSCQQTVRWGCGNAQTVSRGLPTAGSRVRAVLSHVEFVVGIAAALRQDFSGYFGFPCQSFFPPIAPQSSSSVIQGCYNRLVNGLGSSRHKKVNKMASKRWGIFIGRETTCCDEDYWKKSRTGDLADRVTILRRQRQ